MHKQQQPPLVDRPKKEQCPEVRDEKQPFVYPMLCYAMFALFNSHALYISHGQHHGSTT